MAVTLSTQGFHACNGVVMGKKSQQYVETYKKAPDPLLSEDEEEALDRKEEPIDLSEDDETARADEDGGLQMGNQTARSMVDVEANTAQIPQQNRRPQQSRGDTSIQSVDDVRSSGKTVKSRDITSPRTQNVPHNCIRGASERETGLEERCPRLEGKFQGRDPRG
ncbi:hypothetical protein R1sor_019050 [Riccia sorocarpa]|uniref:Uncharacterized protein n=1 Tax=Riccia sorocarpa TaxID=122646 RepID=A0ABD3IBJ2_9MARC